MYAKMKNLSAYIYWDKFLDVYLDAIDFCWNMWKKLHKKSGTVNFEHDLVAPNSRLLVRITAGALVVVFGIVLCSCAQNRRELSPSSAAMYSAAPQGKNAGRKPSNTPMRSPTGQDESLYVKKETVIIKRKETGSPTGSMWADAKQSRDLFAEERPQRVGDVVTISIPEDMRYNATGAGAAQAATPSAAATALGAESNKGNAALTASAGTAEALKDFRMEIVAVESSGDMYLRGVREYTNQNGRRMVAVNAKIPRRLVRSSTIDARELTAVTVNEDVEGTMADYQAPGWDKVVSRKVSGFVPDVNSELASVEDAKREVEVNRDALRQQTLALQEERERLLKDRARMAKAVAAASAQEASENNADAGAAQKSGGKDEAKKSGAGKAGANANPTKADANGDGAASKSAGKTAPKTKSGAKDDKPIGGTTP